MKSTPSLLNGNEPLIEFHITAYITLQLNSRNEFKQANECFKTELLTWINNSFKV